jgi:hypothetical protein
VILRTTLALALVLLVCGTASAQSPDNTRVPPAPKIVDAAGAAWTLNGTAIMRNGVFTNGSGTILTWCGGQVRTFGTDSRWWRWNGSGWVQEGTVDPCAPPPPVVAHPCDITAAQVTTVPAGVPFRVGFCMPLDDQTGAPATVTSCRVSVDGSQAWDAPVSPIGAPSPISAKNYYEIGLTLGVVGPHTLTAQCRRKDPPATVESPLSGASLAVAFDVTSGTGVIPLAPLPPSGARVIR